ncbi:MAG: tetratricopeptide repeat protein [Blastocatellia bacterium]|nr:tetratricopeptide repeat protein [Blastocatellia bacterium]
MTFTDIANKYNKLKLFFPILLIIVCFANTLGYDFVYDDNYQIVEASKALSDLSKENLIRLFDRDIWGFFKQHFESDIKTHSSYYRPIFGLIYIFNYQYGELNPFAWHLTSVILHIFAVLLAYKLIKDSLQMIGQDKELASWMSLITTLCFAIHPVQTESVAWVASYVNALTSIFIFSSLIFYLKLDNSSLLWLIPSSLFYMLALLSKEAAIILPILLIVYELFIIPNNLNLLARLFQTFLRSTPFIITTIIYFYIRILVFGAITPATVDTNFSSLEKPSFIVLLLSLPKLFLTYLKLLIWPISSSPIYSFSLVNKASLSFYLALIFLFLLIALAIFLSYKHKIVILAISYLIIPLLPVLNIRFFKLEDLVHDRYLYLSTIGFGLLIAFLLYSLNNYLLKKQNSLKQVHSLILVLIFLLISFSSFITIKQNQVWASDWHFWSTCYKSFPNSCITNLELGRLNEELKKDDQLALIYYLQAKKVCPDSLMLSYKLALLYGRNNDLTNSELEFQNVLRNTKNRFILSTAYFNLGFINEKRGSLDKALELYQTGLKLNPTGQNSQQVQAIIKELTENLSSKTQEK